MHWLCYFINRVLYISYVDVKINIAIKELLDYNCTTFIADLLQGLLTLAT